MPSIKPHSELIFLSKGYFSLSFRLFLDQLECGKHRCSVGERDLVPKGLRVENSDRCPEALLF